MEEEGTGSEAARGGMRVVALEIGDRLATPKMAEGIWGKIGGNMVIMGVFLAVFALPVMIVIMRGSNATVEYAVCT